MLLELSLFALLSLVVLRTEYPYFVRYGVRSTPSTSEHSLLPMAQTGMLKDPADISTRETRSLYPARLVPSRHSGPKSNNRSVCIVCNVARWPQAMVVRPELPANDILEPCGRTNLQSAHSAAPILVFPVLRAWDISPQAPPHC